MSAALSCRRLSLTYGAELVVRDLDLEVAAGETVAVLGPSGSGKTTLLSAVAGFLAPAAGEVRIRGRVVASPAASLPPESRSVGMVFQSYALWPHLTALDTVAYPMRRGGLPAGEARARSAALLERMGIGHLAARRPAQLSGGEQQRVGLARALARDADIYLFDEPTAHLDTALRAVLADEIAEQRRRSDAAALYATHDVAEALGVADRVALLREGRLVQLGTPAEVYERPADLWAARLTGPASLLEVTIAEARGERSELLIAGVRVPVLVSAARPLAAGPARILVRPDWARLGGGLPAVVRAARYRGPHTDYRLETEAGLLELRERGTPVAAPGEVVTWTLERARAVAA